MPTVEYLNYEVLDDFGWSINDDDLFEKAANEDLSRENYGDFEAGQSEWILDAAQSEGLDWPLSCRTGACANCAAILIEGEIDMSLQQILSPEEVNDRNVRLTCIGSPATDHVKIIYNAKFIDYLENRVV